MRQPYQSLLSVAYGHGEQEGHDRQENVAEELRPVTGDNIVGERARHLLHGHAKLSGPA